MRINDLVAGKSYIVETSLGWLQALEYVGQCKSQNPELKRMRCQFKLDNAGFIVDAKDVKRELAYDAKELDGAQVVVAVKWDDGFTYPLMLISNKMNAKFRSVYAYEGELALSEYELVAGDIVNAKAVANLAEACEAIAAWPDCEPFECTLQLAKAFANNALNLKD